MNFDGSDRKQLTNIPVSEVGASQPSYSLDGKKIVFCSQRIKNLRRNSLCNIYIMNADGSELKKLHSERHLSGISISPDGEKILFNSDFSKLCIMDIESGEIKIIKDAKNGRIGGTSWQPILVK